MYSPPLEYLFPAPSLPPSQLAPAHFPGVSPKSTAALQRVLKDNHAKWHIFFNEMRFHNHAAHRAVASWALGADAGAIQKGYELDCHYEKPAFESPGAIRSDNFYEHLGDDKYYNAYMQFLTQFIKEKGVAAALEEFVFSRKANVGPSANIPTEKQPQILSRFFAGLLHPMIHAGYGVEFGLPGMVVEGIAQTVVHNPTPGLLTLLGLFEDEPGVGHDTGASLASSFSAAMSGLGSPFGKVLPQSTSSSNAPVADSGPHALTILSRVLSDPKFASPGSAAIDEDRILYAALENHAKDVAAYANMWVVDPTRLANVEGELDRKIEELAWAICVLYGVAGWTDMKLGGKDGEDARFNADFFFMHLVTSSIFLPSLCAILSPTSQACLLKSYLMSALIWAVARGRPRLDVKGFVAATQDVVAIPGLPASLKSKSESASVTGVDEESKIWSRILDEARVHQDEHLTKTIRALAGWAAVFGTRKAREALKGGDTAGTEVDLQSIISSTELPGSQYLDGGFFFRAAILILGRMGWDLEKGDQKEREAEGREGRGAAFERDGAFWDFKGFYDQDGQATKTDGTKG